MKNLNNIAADLFNKIRGRFPSVEIGDANGTPTVVPEESRFYDFSFHSDKSTKGKVSISLDEENGITVIVGKDMTEKLPSGAQSSWFDFLRELRRFSKKRMMNFDVRDITKSNLQKRDYKFLAANRPGEDTMAESKMYGTNKTSYQRIGNARLAIKHTAPINTESATARTQKINSIFIESPEGERFKYPYRHLSGARAMARHVSEGGTAYDEFGQHISNMSEELSKLKKFNTYMNRSGVMAETLGEYTGIVKERASELRKEIQNLQKENYYREAVDGFTAPIVEEVPEDVAENWIDQLTIKQFNEELKDVFPYIYKLVGEATKAKDLEPEDLLDESDPCWKGYKQIGMKDKGGKSVPNCVPESEVVEDAYRGQKKFKMAMDNHKNFKVYVSKDKIVQNKFLATAVSNTSGKEPEGVKSIGRTPQDAVQQVVQKLDSRVEKAQKVTGDATLDFNVMFTRELLTNDAEDLGIENIKDIYVRIVQGPKLQVANMIAWDTIREFLPKEKFTKAAKRTEGGSPLIGARLSAAQAREANIVANGRYILGTPKPIRDSSISDESFAYYEYDMSFESIVVDKNEKVSFNKPAVTVGTRRTESSVESDNLDEISLDKIQKVRDRAASRIAGAVGKTEKDPNSKSGLNRYVPPTDKEKELGQKGVKSFRATRRAIDRKMKNKTEEFEPEEKKTPLGEFILSYFDRESGKFPKGRTAVLTAVEKDYGDEYVESARQFVEKIESVTMEFQQREAAQSRYPETEMIKRLAGV